jgi:Family of unknown function (DUF6962)
VQLNPSATELTTAATDAALGFLCLAVLLRLVAIPVSATWKRALWCWVFGLLGLASVLGAVVHGLELPESLFQVLWQPLYLLLGLTVALFLIGGIHDWRGEAAARALLPWAIGLGASFFALTQLLGGAFLIFVVYEATAMVATLAMYTFLSATGRLTGAGMITLGIGLSIVAAAVQASALGVRLIVPFDHNGLFHLVQLTAIIALENGVRRGLRGESQWDLRRVRADDERHH